MLKPALAGFSLWQILSCKVLPLMDHGQHVAVVTFDFVHDPIGINVQFLHLRFIYFRHHLANVREAVEDVGFFSDLLGDLFGVVLGILSYKIMDVF
ncbi:hypothetical protein MAH4_15680 [Sessilibacter sp. MAH4]